MADPHAHVYPFSRGQTLVSGESRQRPKPALCSMIAVEQGIVSVAQGIETCNIIMSHSRRLPNNCKKTLPPPPSPLPQQCDTCSVSLETAG